MLSFHILQIVSISQRSNRSLTVYSNHVFNEIILAHCVETWSIESCIRSCSRCSYIRPGWCVYTTSLGCDSCSIKLLWGKNERTHSMVIVLWCSIDYFFRLLFGYMLYSICRCTVQIHSERKHFRSYEMQVDSVRGIQFITSVRCHVSFFTATLSFSRCFGFFRFLFNQMVNHTGTIGVPEHVQNCTQSIPVIVVTNKHISDSDSSLSVVLRRWSKFKWIKCSIQWGFLVIIVHLLR